MQLTVNLGKQELDLIEEALLDRRLYLTNEARKQREKPGSTQEVGADALIALIDDILKEFGMFYDPDQTGRSRSRARR